MPCPQAERDGLARTISKGMQRQMLAAYAQDRPVGIRSRKGGRKSCTTILHDKTLNRDAGLLVVSFG
eukprot:g8924.t1